MDTETFQISIIADGHEVSERRITAINAMVAIMEYEKETGYKLDNQQFTIKRIKDEHKN